ncbi:hypothetical protein HMPREF9134_00847 [Porphyromonas catoniae F0037]|uniref:Uncharacterized protein n=1 Tax=Porphyromonas catoniae F0037 TaxID=1127696 RepID=L1NF12_9PORP|nr:hypothetical protein HMPREF9134_00847 [Porphyromonas catoniae F0037]
MFTLRGVWYYLQSRSVCERDLPEAKSAIEGVIRCRRGIYLLRTTLLFLI